MVSYFWIGFQKIKTSTLRVRHTVPRPALTEILVWGRVATRVGPIPPLKFERVRRRRGSRRIVAEGTSSSKVIAPASTDAWILLVADMGGRSWRWYRMKERGISQARSCQSCDLKDIRVMCSLAENSKSIVW